VGGVKEVEEVKEIEDVEEKVNGITDGRG